MSPYEQAEGETPIEWIERLLREIASKVFYLALAMFLLGYVVGSFK